MANSIPGAPSTQPTPPTPPTPKPSSSKARSLQSRVGCWLLVLLISAAVLGAAYTWITLHWSYSEGQRAGVLQKFSRKGWLCKTWEGEIAMYVVGGIAPQLWNFTVRDAEVAAKLQPLVGSPVRLQYEEHVGVPTSCFGDTRYYVRSFELAEDARAVN